LSLWPRWVRCWRPDVSVRRACRSDWPDSRPSGGVNTSEGRFGRRTPRADG